MHDSSKEPTETKPVQATVPRLTPGPIIETTWAFAQSCILLAAIELDLFTQIAQGMNKPETLAHHAEVSENALRRLLAALSVMGFLQRNANDYTLTPLSERFLVRSQKSYMGNVVLQNRQEWEAWIHLSDVVRTGQPVRFINEDPLGGPFFAPLDEYLFPLIHPLMHMICQRLEVGSLTHPCNAASTPTLRVSKDERSGSRRGDLQVLDLGAGTAPGAIAALELNADAHAVAMDFAEALARAQVYAQKHGVGNRLEYWPAQLETVELPPNHFDLIFVSHVFRILGAEHTQRLVHQCYQSLTPGGKLVVIETYNEQGMKLFPYIVSLNMLINTRHGDTFTSQQMHEWLSAAGFEVEAWPNVGPDLVLVATRL